MAKKNKTIRVGDWVKVIKPVFVIRVGYPKQVSDYLPQVEIDHGSQLREIAHHYSKADKSWHI
jgi:hypothetical protein